MYGWPNETKQFSSHNVDASATQTFGGLYAVISDKIFTPRPIPGAEYCDELHVCVSVYFRFL